MSENNSVVLGEVSIALFQQYTGNKDVEKLQKHVESIHQKALAHLPYRCISESRFLKPRMALHSKYHEIFDALRENPSMKLLDLGCCMGTDLRKLVIDQYPEEQLTGIDISSEFIELGYELFEDRDRTKITFLAGNVLDDSSLSADGKGKGDLDHLAGTFDVIYCGSVVHLLDEEVIPKFVSKVYCLLKDGGKFMARNVGSFKPTNVRAQDENSQLGYIHSADSISEVLKSAKFQKIEARLVPYTEERRGASAFEFLEFEATKIVN